ncbi:hypothetical protein FAGKG844_40016 [Frankia sp. AgKG'84/4]
MTVPHRVAGAHRAQAETTDPEITDPETTDPRLAASTNPSERTRDADRGRREAGVSQ